MLLLVVCLFAFAGPPLALPLGMEKKTAQKFVAAARETLGLSYVFGGRLRNGVDGIDCQGLVFYAAERICPCGWKSYSTQPTVSVARAELGRRVAGLDPVDSENLDLSLLMPGDVIMEVGAMENPAEPAIGKLNGKPVWVWHVGIYSGDGNWLNANPFAGQVVEESLSNYLAEHRIDGIFVTRMRKRPHPTRCRRHRPMLLNP